MKKLSLIIFVSYQPLTPRFEKDFYTDTLLAKGFQIEFWDLSPLFHNQLIMHETKQKEFVRYFSAYDVLEEAIRQNHHHAFFIFHINYYAAVYKLFKLFSKYKCFTGFFARGMLPFPLLKESLYTKVLKKMQLLKKRSALKGLVLNQASGWAKKLNIIQPFNIVFTAGTEGIYSVGYGYKREIAKAKQININAVDYDQFMAVNQSDSRLINNPYCVFLDEYLPHHPDFEILKIPKIDANAYYDSLNTFFDKIEHDLGIKVIIAAHPTSDYENYKAYRNRLTLKYKTAELVKNSVFVMAHISTSISLAVLFQKPLLFLYSNEIMETYAYTRYPHILFFADILNAKAVNVNNYETITSLPIHNHDAEQYERYKYKYLTSPESEKSSTKKILLSFLESLKFGAAH